MDKMSTLVFLPLIVGFVLLFLPNRTRFLSKTLTLIISILTFIWGVNIYRTGASALDDYSLSILQIDNFKLDLLLSANPLGVFVLMFAMGFGLLITL